MRFVNKINHSEALRQNSHDPMAGVTNLFDVSMAFVVAVIMALFALLPMHELLRPDAEWTLVRTTPQGETEVIPRKDREIKVRKVTGNSLSGNGTRLGIAYQLEDGRVIYVPEKE